MSIINHNRLIAGWILGSAIAATLLLPVVAQAAPGDSENTAVRLSVGQSVQGTLTPVPGSSTDYRLIYSVDLTAGQTLVATYTVAPSVTQPDLLGWASFRTSLDWLPSAGVSSTTRVTRLLAPESARYYLGAFGQGSAGTFSLDTTIGPAVDYTLSKISAPGKAKKRKAFTISSTLTGTYDELTVPVRFVVSRKSGAAYRVIPAILQRRIGSLHTVFVASVSLPAGTYRVHAEFKDAAHPRLLANAARSIVVK